MGDLRDIIKGTTFSVTTMGNTKHCYHCQARFTEPYQFKFVVNDREASLSSIELHRVKVFLESEDPHDMSISEFNKKIDNRICRIKTDSKGRKHCFW
jgi:hypothetical protein